jgi:predicted permease
MRTRLSEVLKEGARGSSGHVRGRQGLLVAQSALAMVLLMGAGLLLATLVSLRNVDPGFESEGMVAVRFPVRPPGYESARAVWEMERAVLQRLRGAPGVVSAAAASNLPLERGVNFPVSIAGRPDDFEGAVEWRGVTPGYFETLGIELRAGRGFAASDETGGPPVAIVNEAFVRRYFPDENPIGQRVEIGRFRGDYLHPTLVGPAAEIVGVAADVREISLRTEPRRTLYVPAAQAHDMLVDVLDRMPVLVVRAPGARGELQGRLRDRIREADPALPAPEIFPLDQVVAESLARERFGATLFGTFAAVALALTAFGIYGVLAYTVRQRRREIGIRMALGAGGGEVARLVARQAIAPVLLGLVLGGGAALGLSRLVAGYLWGVSPTDPTTLVTVAALLVGVALLASWLPAREAVALDPVRSLTPE